MSLFIFLLGATILMLSISVLSCFTVILHLRRKNKVLQERMARYEEIIEGQELLADRMQCLIEWFDHLTVKAQTCGGYSNK